MRNMRKTLALILAMIMALGLLAGCGGSGNAGGGAASAPVEVPDGGYTFPWPRRLRSQV